MLLETTAGQGTNIGYRFEAPAETRTAPTFPDRFGVCFDTCHTFAAGYDITTREEYDRSSGSSTGVLGLENLRVFTS